jgi:rifampicin phosphotransferase
MIRRIETRPPFVVPLASLRRSDRERVGAKAASLGELIAAGFPVPDGLAVSCAAFAAHLEQDGLGQRIGTRLAGLAAHDTHAIEEASGAIRSLVIAAPVPSGVRDAVVAGLDGVGRDGRMAVRSSAVAEDLEGASFAGQYDTLLDVAGAAAVVDALRVCWASAFGARALAYRLRHGFAAEAVAMGAVVQRLVPATAAGVAFTADPRTGERDRVVINAVRGLGEALVSGRANADLYVLSRDGHATIEAHLAGAEPVLSEASRRALAELAVRVERQAGVPQDLEWALDADGTLALLQARPITGLPPEPVALAEAERPILAYMERVREMVPSAITPLMQGIALEVIVPALVEQGVRHGFVPRRLVRGTEAASRSVRGRLYIDASAVCAVLCPGLDELQFVELMEHGQRPPLRSLRPTLLLTLGLRMLWLLPRVLVSLYRLDRLERSSAVAFEALLRPLVARGVETLSNDELVALVRLELPGLREALLALPPANGLARAFGTPAVSALAFMVTRWAGEPRETAGVLLSGLPGMVEVECAKALFALADLARRAPRVRAALLEDPATALERLAGVPESEPFRRGFELFLERFGHRAIEEVELLRPRWREQPSYPLSVIAGYLARGGSDPALEQARRQVERQAMEDRIARRLRFRPLRRVAFAFALRVAQRASLASENTKSDIMRLMQLMRAAALERGRRLVAAGVLRESEDIFFLTLHELQHVAADDLRPRVAVRRAEYRAFQHDATPRLMDAGGRAIREALPRPEDVGPGTLSGIAASPGVARGRVRIVIDPSGGVQLSPDDVLVAPFTDPAWTPLFLTVRAVVVETGSLLSHASIVARELRLPSVVGVPFATRRLVEGEAVEVDGTRGLVRRLEHTSRRP